LQVLPEGLGLESRREMNNIYKQGLFNETALSFFSYECGISPHSFVYIVYGVKNHD
jgi:hypothetical protein